LSNKQVATVVTIVATAVVILMWMSIQSVIWNSLPVAVLLFTFLTVMVGITILAWKEYIKNKGESK